VSGFSRTDQRPGSITFLRYHFPRLRSILWLRGVAIVVVVSSAIVWVRLKPDTTSVPRVPVRLTPDTPSEPVRLKPDTTSDRDKSSSCDAQAARVALWLGRGTISAQVHEPAWLGHYSERDDVCYALIAGRVALATGDSPPLVTELWNAFEATLLATSTSDGRTDIQRDFCRIDLAEKPFTSCLVADFFIRQHFAN